MLAASGSHTMAVKGLGLVWGWGRNNFGQLGPDPGWTPQLSLINLFVYTVTPSSGVNGSLNPSTPQTLTGGEITSFTVTPNSGYEIDWVSGCDGSLLSDVFTIAPATEDCTVAANFTPITLTLGVTVTGLGTVHSTPGVNMQCTGGCAQGYEQDTIVTLTSEPDTNYSFTSWAGDCTGTGDCVVAMDAAKSVTATFSVKNTTSPFVLESTQSTYPSIQQAYNNIGSSDVIKVKASYPITEALVFDKDVSIRLEGGYDGFFAGIVSATILNGRLTISAGQVTVSNIIIR